MAIHGDNWLIIGLMMAAAFAMGMTLLTLNRVVAPAKPNPVKRAPYESGVPDVEPVRPRYTAHFYAVAMIYLVFAVEAMFFYTWAVVFDDLGLYGFLAMLAFVLLTFDGYVYAWKKGALEWV